MDILNFGSLNIDYVYQVDAFVRPGETKSAQRMDIHCGGKGLNQSVALARAGLSVYHAGFVGTDGGFLAEQLAHCGVNTQYLRPAKTRNGHAVIQVRAGGENCILLHPGTNHMLTPAYVAQVLSHFGPDDVVVLQNETNMVEEIIAQASRKGMRIAFNAAPIDEAVRSYPLEKVTWLFVNELEGAWLSGQQSYPAIATALRQRYPHTQVILTLGGEGCLSACDQGLLSVGVCPVTPVDTTAAGDTFTGFFLRGVLAPVAGFSPLALATVASALTVLTPGAAASIPSLEQVLSAQLQPGPGRPQ